ncbi:hypothetical protein [Streptomyces prunicolor]|uniref:Uncharacterized protein n=1 Tax=Streptomyces prunicolor TaxID=67348 RepID=A0ABU4F5S7_9ACTN|nr:hypothetical protein [Streptomyces prunicolor]MDV7215938.1 hypothetical protein [Streptomyces prunicolor]
MSHASGRREHSLLDILVLGDAMPLALDATVPSDAPADFAYATYREDHP